MEIFSSNSGSPYFKFQPHEQKILRLPDEIHVLGIDGIRRAIDDSFGLPATPREKGFIKEIADVIESSNFERMYG